MGRLRKVAVALGVVDRHDGLMGLGLAAIAVALSCWHVGAAVAFVGLVLVALSLAGGEAKAKGRRSREDP